MNDRSAMIRVDQAGEYGATRIYAGQLAVMGDRAAHSGEIRAMADQETGHLAEFDKLIARRGVRPTALQPFWSVAGYALGAATALIGPEAATGESVKTLGRISRLVREEPLRKRLLSARDAGEFYRVLVEAERQVA